MKTCKISSKKDVKKLIRGIFQASILIFLLYIIITAIFTFQRYEVYDLDGAKRGNKGFISLSYFGIDRNGSLGLLSEKRLEEQLRALKDSGYVTITQKDVLEYYEKGKELPEKSLFLIFEDGRRDTAIFSQKIMEKYNYIATMLTYADKFEKKDMKFLMPDELLELEESTFWELGTNGYRLEYINVFDRDEDYLGEIDSLEFAEVSQSLDRNYNHYLMDYIRDEYNIPKESHQEMKKRITYDYQQIETIYTNEIGKVPEVYILMHANTGQYGTNDRVSAVNEEQIRGLFKMNFNREGYALNTRDSSIYDLTRIQPQAHWYTNHLLMRIWDDTKQDITFVTGDVNKARDWEKIEGQSEFAEDEIILTSMPQGKGILRLKESETFNNLLLSVYLQGNQWGSQEIYFRADKDLESYVMIQVVDNILNVYEKLEGNKELLFTLELDEYKKGHLLQVSLEGKKMTVFIDKKEAVNNLALSSVSQGYIFLGASWSGSAYSQRNLTDDVYDGVFKQLVITSNENEETKILFDNQLKGWEGFTYKTKKIGESIVNWFIDTL